MAGLNCWEFPNCVSHESCPVEPEHGRECFAVTGYVCPGEKQDDQIRVH